jgi:DNA (cytosine-5)-methyltransferase 1
MTLTSVDLFTGIGGMALAMRDVCRPLLYCDKDRTCREILMKNMAKKRLPRAPIVDDVCDFQQIRKIVRDAGGRVDIVVFTSSCKGFSILSRIGLSHPETGLIVKALELVHMLRPPLVFMENVANIKNTNDGDDYVAVVQALNDMGYELASDIFSASDVGAPHHRRRWYGIAYMPGRLRRVANIIEAAESRPSSLPDWHSDKHKRSNEPHRVPSQPDSIPRAVRLGNAVVPRCALYAFHTLWHRIHPNAKSLRIQERLREPLPLIHIVLDPKLGAAPRKPHAKVSPLKRPVTRHVFPTPCASSMMGSCRKLTERCTHLLPTAVRFWTEMRGDRFEGVLNPRFVEFLMGFPLDWTRVHKRPGT